jgi:DNA-binding beta-propeller fold protein YncE
MMDSRRHTSKHALGTVLLLTVIVLIVSTLPCWSAPRPILYPSYTYDYSGRDVPSPPAYIPSRVITGNDLGVGSLNEPADLFVSSSGRIYLVDKGNDRVIYLSEDFDVLQVVTSFHNGDSEDRFCRPEGIFVTDSEEVFVADTGNARVIQLDSEGAFVRSIGAPTPDVAEILTSDFDYKPARIGVDLVRGKMYVVSKGAYDGILVFDMSGKFTGFVGAPRVTPTVADLFWMSIATREQRQRKSLFLPIEYVSLDLDADGLVYATVAGYTNGGGVKRLTPAGRDVLLRTGSMDVVGDPLGGRNQSAFIDVVARPNKTYSVLDATASRVFTYDYFGNLLYVFGAKGDRVGLVQVPSAIAALGHNIIVVDSSLNRLTVYSPTAYGSLIHAALEAYDRGDFESSTDYWWQVSKLNANYEMAYQGIGRSYALAGDFAEAMRYFRLGNDRQRYSAAFAHYREEYVRQHIGWIMTGIIAAAVLIYVVRRFRLIRRANRALYDCLLRAADSRSLFVAWSAKVVLRACEYARGVGYSLHVILHPYSGFADLKAEKKGNVVTATILVILVTLTYVIARQYTGFIFNTVNLAELNIYVELFSVIVPLLLWCGINWAVTSVLEGKGNLRDVYIMSAYALTPIIVINIPLVILSHLIVAEEGSFYYLLLSASVIWTVVLLLSGSLVIHEYSVSRTLLTSVITLAGMATTIFLALLQFILANRAYTFISSIVAELFVRI